MLSHCDVRVVLKISSLRLLRVSNTCVRSAFFQTGPAQLDIYFVPPRESTKRTHYWLLLTASFELSNSNTKGKPHSNTLPQDLGREHLPVKPHLFYGIENGDLLLLVSKIFDDILATGLSSVVK